MAGRGERGVGWGGMYREGHKYGFPNKTTKRVLLRSKMSTLKSMRGEFTRRFLRSYCFCLTSSRKGSVFVISFLHFGISHLDLNYADCADLTWLPASQHPPPPLLLLQNLYIPWFEHGIINRWLRFDTQSNVPVCLKLV